MKYTYEVTEKDGTIFVNIYKDNYLMLHQPHHPQQNFETDGPTWKDVETATQWAESEIFNYNNLIQIESEDNVQAGANPTKEEQAESMKAHLALLLGVSVDQIQITPPPSEE